MKSLEESAIPLLCDSLITVLLACQHVGAGGGGGGGTPVLRARCNSPVSAERPSQTLTTSSAEILPDCVAAPPSFMIVRPFPSSRINFPTSHGFYLPIILFSHYLSGLLAK